MISLSTLKKAAFLFFFAFFRTGYSSFLISSTSFGKSSANAKLFGFGYVLDVRFDEFLVIEEGNFCYYRSWMLFLFFARSSMNLMNPLEFYLVQVITQHLHFFVQELSQNLFGVFGKFLFSVIYAEKFYAVSSVEAFLFY